MSDSSTSSTVFDADAFATEPPELRIGGKVYRGRILSIVEWSGFLERFLTATENELADVGKGGVFAAKTMVASHQYCVEYLRAVLPKPEKGRPDPVTFLEKQGGRALKSAFAHFFGHQCYVQGVALRTPTDAARGAVAEIREALKSADGTSSSESIAKAPSAGAPPS